MNKITMLITGFVMLAVLVLPNSMTTTAQASAFPGIIALPNGFQPEGIAIGGDTTMYVGSIPTGAIYQADLRTGQGAILVPPQAGRVALGMSFDPRTNFLYVAGGSTGSAFVYDATIGTTVGVFQLTTEPNSLVNDVAITRDAVYFTDSFRPVFYRLPLLPGGRLPDATAVEEIALGGDFDYLPNGINSNGIVATEDGKTLLIVHTDLGHLYRVDPASGLATRIDPVLPLYPDGLVLNGRTLYVVNFSNQINEVRLNPKLTSGEITRVITDPSFDTPATAARFGSSLYVVNARFETVPTADTEYWVTQVQR